MKRPKSRAGRASKNLFAQEKAATNKAKVTANKAPLKPAKKKSTRSARAKQLVEEFGLCPISMEPMRRPVLPSSGQAYDEINIVRFSANGRKRCPVSGATMKFARGEIARTSDHALRNVIRHQASHAKVYIPPIDCAELLKDVRELRQDAVKAFVDDTYLGYISSEDLQVILQELSEPYLKRNLTATAELPPSAAIYRQLVAECLACRKGEIVQAALRSLNCLEAPHLVLIDSDLLRECLGVGEDPDCRGGVLSMLADSFSLPFPYKTAFQVLSFETESVPVQQSQAHIADIILCGKYSNCTDVKQHGQLLNQALKVRSDLHGCTAGNRSFWFTGLKAMMTTKTMLDACNLQRLFLPRNKSALIHLCDTAHDVMLWHFTRHPGAMQHLLGFIKSSTHMHMPTHRTVGVGAFDDMFDIEDAALSFSEDYSGAYGRRPELFDADAESDMEGEEDFNSDDDSEEDEDDEESDMHNVIHSHAFPGFGSGVMWPGYPSHAGSTAADRIMHTRQDGIAFFGSEESSRMSATESDSSDDC